MIFLHLLFLFVTSFVFGEYNKTKIFKKNEDLYEQLKKGEKTVNDITLLKIFEDAVESYLNEDWDACIQGFHNLEYKYKKYKNAVIRCRRKCNIESKIFIPLLSENIEDLHFYEKKIKETLCIVTCNQEYRELTGKNALKRLPQSLEFKLMFAKYYEYLHICYFQKNYFQKAADAVFTYLIYHPDHKASKLSLAYYMRLPEVKNDSIHNLLNEPFINDYMKGIKAYVSEYFDEAIIKLESSLISYIESEEKCRFYCEGPLEFDWNPEFIISLSNHFVYNLHCKRRCSRFLKTLNGEYRHDFLVDHFNYLQFSYYKLHDIKKACEAVASYLLFYPADEIMLNNKNYYASLPMVKENYFTPRKEIVAYITRQEYELHLLLYIHEEFTAFEDKLITFHSELKSNIEDKGIQIINNET